MILKINNQKLAICLLLILLTPISLYGQEASFTGEGSAFVVDNDKVGAVKLAYQAALKKAVSNAMESLIRKGSKDESNFNLKKAELLKGPFDFVIKEEQISNTLEGQRQTIMIRIDVDERLLTRYLGQKGILATQNEERKREEFPSAMILVTEELNGQVNYSPYSSTVIQQALLDKNFDVVDEKIVEKNIKHDQAVQAMISGDLRAAQAMALQYGSGMLVTGRAVAQQSAIESGGMQAYGANITLEAVEADTGRVMATASADGTYPHINAMTGSRKAVEGAAQKAIDDLIKKIEKGFETSSESVEISVSAITFAQLAVFKKILKRDFQEISAIKQKSFNGQVAKLDIKIDSGTTDFIERVALKDFGTFKLKVLNFSPGKVDFILRMNDR